MEADFATRFQASEERQRREQSGLEALMAEQVARIAFIEKGEQRLLDKGQEQVARGRSWSSARKTSTRPRAN